MGGPHVGAMGFKSRACGAANGLKALTNKTAKLRFFPQSHLNFFVQPLIALR